MMPASARAVKRRAGEKSCMAEKKLRCAAPNPTTRLGEFPDGRAAEPGAAPAFPSENRIFCEIVRIDCEELALAPTT